VRAMPSRAGRMQSRMQSREGEDASTSLSPPTENATEKTDGAPGGAQGSAPATGFVSYGGSEPWPSSSSTCLEAQRGPTAHGGAPGGAANAEMSAKLAELETLVQRLVAREGRDQGLLGGQRKGRRAVKEAIANSRFSTAFSSKHLASGKQLLGRMPTGKHLLGTGGLPKPGSNPPASKKEAASKVKPSEEPTIASV